MEKRGGERVERRGERRRVSEKRREDGSEKKG
jgi:hypothetical protein